MDSIMELANYGSLGIICVVMVVGIKTLYKRNCEYGDKVNDTVSRNTVAMEQHTEAIRGLVEIISKCKGPKA